MTFIRQAFSHPTTRVMLLASALAGSATVLQLHLMDGPLAAPGHAAYPILPLVAGFALAECLVVHLEIRRQVHSISMSELPLVLGLVLFPPAQLVAARLLGAVLALVLHRRQASLKLAFNLCNFALETTLAATLYAVLLGGDDVFSLIGSGAALASTFAANLVSGAAVMAAVSIHEGRVNHRLFSRVIGSIGISCLANTSFALVAATVVIHEPLMAWSLPVLLGIAYVDFRAHAALRQRYDGLELLYGFTRTIAGHHSGDEALALALSEAANLLRAERAQIMLLDEDGRGGTISYVAPDGILTSSLADLKRATSLELLALRSDSAVLAPRTTKDEDLLRRLRTSGHKDALVTPLHRDGDVVGTFLVADRFGHVSTFDAEDRKLFETVAAQTSSMLENRHLINRLRREVTSKEHQALHDSLTGLANRTLFHQEVTEIIDDHPSCAAVMLMDLDRFKDINDTLGHHTGDRLLVEISRRLCDTLHDRGKVARLGGDEFAILLHPAEDLADAETVARLILAVLEPPFALGDLSIEIGASIGVAMYPAHADNSSSLLQRADVAMYEAKAAHLGYSLYAPERDQTSPRRLCLAADLRTAIQNGDLSVAYQPKIDLGFGRITGVEALVRWTHPRYGALCPDEFIPLAEHTGLIRPLTELVLDRALAQCRMWSDLGLELSVAVNLSARSLIDGDLAHNVGVLLEAAGVSPGLLTFEITESMIMADPARALDTMHLLEAMGISLSIDDFGTGYSSLSYLKRLPVHEVKIDKSFVVTMTVDEDDATIVRSIVDLARNLRLRVVAEGVEDARSLDALIALGCDAVQGFFISKPMNAATLTAALLVHGTSLDSWVRPPRFGPPRGPFLGVAGL